MKRLILSLVSAAFIISGVSLLAATAPTDTAGKPQTTCPVMSGNKINKKLYADVKDSNTGQTVRIYVCCKGCIAAIRKNPAEYIEKLHSEGVKLEVVKK